MAYRRSPRYQEQIKRRLRAMQEGRARARMERAPEIRWMPPDLRRFVIVGDCDTGALRLDAIFLFATTRIDSYRAVVNGKEQPKRMGWSKALERLRKAMPRKCSTRWIGG